MKISNCWSADFETTTDENDCRVWAYSLSNVEDPEQFLYGNNIEDFIKWCSDPKNNYTLYFFNLKFDSAFIISYLLKNGYEYIESEKDRRDNTFTTLITDTGHFFSIKIYFNVKKHRSNYVKIIDAAKIFPGFSVERLAEGFGLPISKLKIDYKAYREVGHILTQEEIDYIRNDVEIVARVLKVMFERDLTKMTIASNALNNFKDHFKYFRRYFPKLDPSVDAEVRKSYKGGFTYLNEKYKEVVRGAGVTLDVNSLYPSIMYNEPMPYGHPVIFEGKYEKDYAHPLYIQVITCKFDIKPDKIPSIQIKHSLDYQGNEYLKSSNDEIVALSLTNPDLELFFEQYDVRELRYCGGFKFKSHVGFFKNYIDYWMDQKIKASKEHNPAQRQIAKLMLNSLYGKFGLSLTCGKKKPVLGLDGELHFIRMPKEEREGIYLPVASWITSYGRAKTIRTSQMIRDYTTKKYGEDRYLYSDTDSCKGNLSDEDLEELKEYIDIDDYKLGAWACEEHFDRFIGIRQKCYCVEIEGKCHPTVAGLPRYLAPIIDFDNFKRGFSTKGLELSDMIKLASSKGATLEEIEKIQHKLTYKYVDGGVLLVDTDFTIK